MNTVEVEHLQHRYCRTEGVTSNAVDVPADEGMYALAHTLQVEVAPRHAVVVAS